MITKNMTERITIYKKTKGRNEDGEVVDGVRKDLFTCWAEAQKATVKEFRSRNDLEAGESLQKRKNTINFNIRYQQEEDVDSSMLIEFRGKTFQIIDVETDYMRKDFSMISAVMIE